MCLREIIIGDVTEALELPLGDRWFVSTPELHPLIGKRSQPGGRAGVCAGIGYTGCRLCGHRARIKSFKAC